MNKPTPIEYLEASRIARETGRNTGDIMDEAGYSALPWQEKPASLTEADKEIERLNASLQRAEQSRSQALAVTREYEKLCDRRARLATEIEKAVEKEREIQSRLPDAVAWIEEHWPSQLEGGVHGNTGLTINLRSLEDTRLTADYLTGWIERAKVRLEAINAEVSEFRRTHQIGE